jgi:class 3 adenylate cyclase/tetratricopeptide (TPR) repeat protein
MPNDWRSMKIIACWCGLGSKQQPQCRPRSLKPPVLTSAPAPDHERDPLSYTPKHLAEKILTSRSALEGERKQVTVLFCDLANSTPIAERIGPEAMHTLLNRFFEVALNEVHRYEGTINQFLGDGFMALFGAPLAHEDHARRAVLAALALQRTLQETHLGEPYGVECAFRMGLNSGLVVVGSIGDNLRMDYSAIGDTTNLAARLQQLAEPGTMLVTESTTRLVQGAVRLEALQPVEVKGKTEPVPIFKVLGTLPRRSPIVSRSERTLSPFVGRERELATLEALFTQVEAGHGQVVGIVAEAGGGKSRLLYEFRQRLQDKRVSYLEGRCLSYGSTMPYHPLIDMLRYNCGISETDSPEVSTEKVYLALHEVGMDAEESAPYLLQLLGVQHGAERLAPLTPEAIRTRTFDTLKQMSLKGSQQHPLLIELEDLHWIDHTSQDYLVSLVESLAGASIMLLTTYRPGYRPPWLEKSYATQMSLQSLAPPEAVTVVRSTREHATLPAHLEQTIIAKSQGNPFFLEELTRAVVEQHDLHAEVTVPDTIHGVLSARIDRLPGEHKQLLQTAAVLGREFAPALLQAMWEGAGPVEAVLLELKHLEFLYDRPGSEEPTYIFKHALTQEVAYDSLLTTRRQMLHAAAGHAMERLYPEWLAEHFEELAHHFTLGAVWEKAFDYLIKSGDKARQSYANQEAITFYTQAIEVSRRITPALDDAQLLPVYEGRGLVWTLQTKYDEAIADFQHMHQLARASGQLRQEGSSLYHLAFAHAHTQPDDQLIEHYAQEAQHLAQRLGDANILAQSLTALGGVAVNRRNVEEAERHFAASLQISRREGYNDALPRTLRYLSSLAYWQGHFLPAIHRAQEGVTVARDLHDGYHELHCLAFLSLACWSQGDYPQAFRITHEVLTKAHERHNRFFLSRMKNHLGWFSRELGAVSHAADLDHESTDLGRTHGIANVEISACINLGFDYLALGQLPRAWSYLAPTLDRVVREAFGSHRWRWQMRILTGLAELSYTTGEYEQALRYVEEGLTEAQATSSQKYVALGWALRGKIIAKLGDTEAAGVELRRALSLAEQLQSPSLLYPIAYDLGHWYESTGKEREAAALYSKAKATIAQMATAVEDEALRSTFLQSALVQEIHERAARLGE